MKTCLNERRERRIFILKQYLCSAHYVQEPSQDFRFTVFLCVVRHFSLCLVKGVAEHPFPSFLGNLEIIVNLLLKFYGVVQ